MANLDRAQIASEILENPQENDVLYTENGMHEITHREGDKVYVQPPVHTSQSHVAHLARSVELSMADFRARFMNCTNGLHTCIVKEEEE